MSSPECEADDHHDADEHRSKPANKMKTSSRSMWLSDQQNCAAAEPPLFNIDPDALKHVRFLGEGAFARAWLCAYRGALVTSKELSPAESEADGPLVTLSDRRMIFRLEGNTLAALRHPNVVKYLGAHYPKECSAASQKSYVVSKYYPSTLIDCVTGFTAGQMPLLKQLQLAYEVACGLEFLDAHNIVHNDIKPSNILVDEDDHALIADFGLARVMQTPKLGVPYAGSPAYMSPEKRRKTPYDRLSDIFSYGIVLYFIFSGEDDSFCDGYKEDVDFRPSKLPSSMPQFVVDLLKRCWATDPSARPTPTQIRCLLAQRTLSHFLPSISSRVFWGRNFCDLSEETCKVTVLTIAVWPSRLYQAIRKICDIRVPISECSKELRSLCDYSGQVSLAMFARLCRWFPKWFEDPALFHSLVLGGWFLGCATDGEARAAASRVSTPVVRCPLQMANDSSSLTSGANVSLFSTKRDAVFEHECEFVVYKRDTRTNYITVRNITAHRLEPFRLPLTVDTFNSFFADQSRD